jgi:hypothetical protein
VKSLAQMKNPHHHSKYSVGPSAGPAVEPTVAQPFWRLCWQLPICVLKLAHVRLALSLLGFERTLSRFGLHAPAPASHRDASPAELILFRQRGLNLRRATRLVPSAFCLARAIALSHWARRSGIRCEFCVGVDREDSTVAAHAWTRMGENVIDDEPNVVARFKVILLR